MCAREKGPPLTEVLFYFALPYGATGGGDRDAGSGTGRNEGRDEEERKEAPWVDAARYPPRAERHG